MLLSAVRHRRTSVGSLPLASGELLERTIPEESTRELEMVQTAISSVLVFKANCNRNMLLQIVRVLLNRYVLGYGE